MQHYHNVPTHIVTTSDFLTIVADALLVLATDSRGIITYCNQLFCEVSGYDEPTLIGKSYEILHARCAEQPLQDACLATIQASIA